MEMAKKQLEETLQCIELLYVFFRKFELWLKNSNCTEEEIKTYKWIVPEVRDFRNSLRKKLKSKRFQ